MKIFDRHREFRSTESGPITVDWVVLTAAIVGLGIAVLTAVSTGVDTISAPPADDGQAGLPAPSLSF